MSVNVTRTLGIIAICFVITFVSRALPFWVFKKRTPPPVITYLGKVLPMAIMCILVFYCCKDVRFTSPGAFLPQAISLAVTVGMHLWKRNTTLSIFCGTVCYMLLVQLVF